MNAGAADSPRDDAYDAVVIGAGLGGLSAASALARSGRRVLVLEQSDGPGGYARPIQRGPYVFDPAVHVFIQGGPDDVPAALFDFFGVRDEFEMLPIAHAFTAAYDDFTFVAPRGVEPFCDAVAEHFPKDAAAVREFLDLGAKIQHQAHQLPPKLDPSMLADATKNAPDLFAHISSTTQEVLDQHFEDPALKSLIGVAWPYLGVVPSRLSAVIYWTLMTLLLESSYYCKGGFGQMVQALVTAIERHGGEVLVNAPATKVLVDDGSVAGVEIAGDIVVRTTVVISNADATTTINELVGADHFPSRFMNKIRRLRPSLSAVVVMIGSSLDMTTVDADHELFRPLHIDHDRSQADIAEGRPGGMWVSVPSLIDPSLAPEDRSVVILTSLAEYDIGKPWEDERDRFVEEMLDAAEVSLPGLRESIEFMESATPPTLERISRNRAGAIYGWENNPAQSGGRRTPHETPVEGLILAGHWTQPGSSSIRAVISGAHAAEIALRRLGAPFEFEHPDHPPA